MNEAIRTVLCYLPVWLACLVAVPALAAERPMVNESARQIPLAYEVDVLVVGGSTGAVSAAVAAAEAGAKVFLAAPRPYLGDDLTATLRLWLEEGEQPAGPLAERIFLDQGGAQYGPDPNRIEFRYEADRPSAGVHRDTDPPSMLGDGIWGDPVKQSVQYDGDVNLTLDLEESQQLKEVRIAVYHQHGTERPRRYKVKQITLFSSDDRKTWKQLAVIENDRREPRCFTLSAPLGVIARYLKVFVEQADDADRMLLGEIEVLQPAPDGAAPVPHRNPPPRPMHVKRVLDDALLTAGVDFLYGCYPTDVLRDVDGNPCGIVMANRAGRQAVVAKTIVDATDRAVVARMAGARFRPYPAGPQTFQRVVIGGEVRAGENLTARTVMPPFRGPFPNPAQTSGGTFAVIDYRLQLALESDRFASWAKADQQARSMTYHPEQQFTSDVLFQVPPDPMHAEEPASGAWEGVAKLPPGAFRPLGVPRMFVLAGSADVSRQQAAKLLRPLALIELGTRIGRAAADLAGSLPGAQGVRLPGQPASDPVAGGDVREVLLGVRPTQELPTIEQDARGLPVLGRYDVVVIGGGTAGAPAGIAAARQGVKTLVVEYLSGLGGVGTTGYISKYWYGNRVGFTATVPGGNAWVIEQKMEWWRASLREAGADVWFGSIGCGALVEEGRVTGAVIVTPQGRGVVLAGVVIDATGNSDVAAAAGADCIYTDETEFAMQGTGLPPRKLGATYTNTDFTIVDETDMLDVWHLLVYSKDKYATAFDQGSLIDTRERRRIVGDFILTLVDQFNRRTYPDTICRGYSNYDSHGYTIDPVMQLSHPGFKKGFYADVPYRCLLPKGLEGILVVGLGISAHRDAMPFVRMQPDVQNLGYAAGVAAAMAVRDGVPPRRIDVRRLQRHLVEIGNLPRRVLSDEDSYPMPPEAIAAAVETIANDFEGASVLLAHREQALPLLRKAYEGAAGEARVRYAQMLAVLGDAGGVETLIEAVRSVPGWGSEPARSEKLSTRNPARLVNMIFALGRARDRRAVPVVLEKLRLLTPRSPFSRHRAVGLALEMIGDSDAARPLSELLTMPDMTGYVHDSIETVRRRDGGAKSGTWTVHTRRASVRELLLARALYRCGDYDGMGERILRRYTDDLRGHLARHARAVLQAGKKYRPAPGGRQQPNGL